eukprot:scaffold35845_cov40-Tisochrysis_lutea.AAC.1
MTGAYLRGGFGGLSRCVNVSWSCCCISDVDCGLDAVKNSSLGNAPLARASSRTRSPSLLKALLLKPRRKSPKLSIAPILKARNRALAPASPILLLLSQSSYSLGIAAEGSVRVITAQKLINPSSLMPVLSMKSLDSWENAPLATASPRATSPIVPN